MSRPDQTIDDSLTRVLLAVLSSSRPTISTCVQKSGLGRGTVFTALHRLRALGLVAFEDGDKARGTLRAQVRVVPLLRQPRR